MFGRAGAVVAGTGDYTLAQIAPGATPSGLYDFSGATQFKLPVAAGYVGQASGECTTIALASSNPGYDVNQVPAPPLRDVIESAGPGC